MQKERITKIVTLITYFSGIIVLFNLVSGFLIEKYLFYKFHLRGSSTGIIGGADGPTAIYVTSKLPYLITVILAVISIAGFVFIILSKKIKK